jgi:hypothetical protein
MTSKTQSVSISTFQSRFSLTPKMQVAIKQLGLLTAYFTAFSSTLAAKLALEESIKEAVKTENPYVISAIICLPIAIVFLLHTLPSLDKHIRKRRRDAAIIGGQLKKGYCQLTPLDEDDQENFDRVDGAHDKVFDWIKKTEEPILFLSGMSGCGKSSLLNASVLPRLRKESPTYTTLLVRSFEDPIQALREALNKQCLIKNNTQVDDLDMKVLLETACENIEDRRLLIVFDQFEELLIIHGEQGEPTQRAIEFLNELKKNPIENLTLLVVFRTEYQGLLIEAGLGPINSDKNLNIVDPFTISGATSFLVNSGLELKKKQIRNILTEACLFEEVKGFVRPITLNMIGLALGPIAAPKQDVAIHKYKAGGILLNYTNQSLDSAGPNGFAKIIMKNMLSSSGTKIPQTLEQLHQKTRLKHGNIESVMLNCEQRGLVRLLDESRHLWEISHDFVASLIAKAVGCDERTLFQKTRPWLMAFLLMGWVLFVVMLFWLSRSMSFREIIEDIGADYAEVYDPNNRELNLSRLPLRNRDISRLKQVEEFKTLASLNLTASTHLTDAGLKHLKNIPLEQLSLKSCYRIIDAGLMHLKDLKQLKILNLSSCMHITGAGFKYMRNLPLKQLDLSGCEKITDAGLEHLKDVPLEQLNLFDCKQITDTSLKHLRNMQLKQLDLRFCSEITDTGLEHLEDMPLEQLNLTFCYKITDDGLVHLEGLKQLTILDLSGLERMTDEGLKHLKGLPLKQLNLSYC